MADDDVKIELMDNPHNEEQQLYGNRELDEFRRQECLCLNCERKNDEPAYSTCHVAGKFYEVCVENNMAVAIAVCGATDEDGKLLYQMPLDGVKATGKIEKIENIFKKSELSNHGPDELWINDDLAAKVDEECCNHCGSEGDCPIYDKINEIEDQPDIVGVITRCGAVDEDGDLRYRPKEEE